MNPASLKTIQILSRSGKALFLIGSAAIGVHLLVLLLDFYLVGKPHLGIVEKDFLGAAFSFSMVPVIGAYIVFSIVIYYFWANMKKALIAAQEKEMLIQKDKVMLESTQHLVGIFAKHITMHNAEILKWVEIRKQVNKQVPESVEKSSRYIAAALETLTEAAFIAPYSNGKNIDAAKINSINDIDELLNKRLQKDSSENELV